jgi:hypothetical protein
MKAFRPAFESMLDALDPLAAQCWWSVRAGGQEQVVVGFCCKHGFLRATFDARPGSGISAWDGEMQTTLVPWSDVQRLDQAAILQGERVVLTRAKLCTKAAKEVSLLPPEKDNHKATDVNGGALSIADFVQCVARCLAGK